MQALAGSQNRVWAIEERVIAIADDFEALCAERSASWLGSFRKSALSFCRGRRCSRLSRCLRFLLAADPLHRGTDGLMQGDGGGSILRFPSPVETHSACR